MKSRILLLSTLAVVCAAGLGLRPPPKDQCRLSLKPVFQSDNEQVWQLTIQTRGSAPYRIASAVIGGSGGLSGDTAPTKGGRNRCEGGVWLIFSKVAPSGDGPAFLKTLLEGQSGSLCQVREIDRGVTLSGVVASQLIGEPREHPLNIPVTLADVAGQRVRLIVGAKSDPLDAEPRGAPNAAPPNR